MPAELAQGRGPWWVDPLSWVELFALSNIAFLAVDVGLAHEANRFAHPAEYIPVGFSLAAPLLLLVAMSLGGLRSEFGAGSPRRGTARRIGLLVGWTSILVGIAGVVFHLESAFFEEQTLKNLVYTAPFAAPLAYTGVGLLLLLDRLMDSRSQEWGRWVVFLAMGGFVGNFVLTLADHAQNGFFAPSEWIGVFASAWAISSLLAVVMIPGNRPLRVLAFAMMAAQIGVALMGFYLHLAADLRNPAESLWDRVLYGAPVFAPLLFADLALLAVLGLWSLGRRPVGADMA